MDVWDVALPARSHWEVERTPELLGGVAIPRADALARTPGAADGPLYRPFDQGRPEYARVSATAIPYYAWANRAPGPTQVWLPVDVSL